MAAVEAVLARANAEAGQVKRFAHGMTVATNALLEFSRAHPQVRTALVATDGFTDVVELGRQARPSLYRLCEAGPQPLAPPSMRFGAPERMGPEGPLRELDERRRGGAARATGGGRSASGGGGATALLRRSKPRAAARRADRGASAGRAPVAFARAGGHFQGVRAGVYHRGGRGPLPLARLLPASARCPGGGAGTADGAGDAVLGRAHRRAAGRWACGADGALRARRAAWAGRCC